MKDHGVRKCISRLEKQGYIKRLIHAGRTKANGYLISGLSERKFRSAHVKKEREANAGKAPITDVSLSAGNVTENNVVEDPLQNQLSDALGGGQLGRAALMNVSADRLEELECAVLNWTMSIEEAVRAIRAEFTIEYAKT